MDRVYEPDFAPLAEWLVNDGKARCEKEDLEKDGENEGSSTVQEITHLLAAYTHLKNKIVNKDITYRFGRVQTINLGQISNNFPLMFDSTFGHNLTGYGRQVTVIIFCVFQVEEISMPAQVENIKDRFLIASPYLDMKQQESSGEATTDYRQH